MIQVLGRAFRILEWLASDAAPPRSLSEIAVRIGVTPATCNHILKTLMEYGYVVQIAPRKGYRLGPMAAMLGRHHNPHEALIQIGQPVVDRVTTETGETTLIAALQGSRRMILCHAEGQQTVRVSSDAIVLEDIYSTATGRLLLAYLPSSEQDSILKNSPPGSCTWGTATTPDGIRQCLEKTRRLGYALNSNHDGMAQLAFPILLGDGSTASIGCFAPVTRFTDSHRKKMFSVLGRAADEVSGKLTR